MKNVETMGADDAASPLLSRFDDAEIADDIQFLLARARTLGTVRANAALARLGLNVRHFAALSLSASGLDPSQRELADFLYLDPSQIVAIVDLLESKGWVERRPSHQDRRVKAIVATRDGRMAFQDARKEVLNAEDESLGDLTDHERETLRSLLQRIAFI